MTTALAPGLDYVDLRFLDQPEVIATGLLHGAEGVALIDPGPATTLETLEAALRDRGFGRGDVRAILLTHIHLDHAGATGRLVERCPNARVFVHEQGAAHVIDPSRLLASAARLYEADMERLWGDVRAVPVDRLHVLGHGAPGGRLRIVGHEVEWAYTPGHAVHHVSYFLQGPRLAFVGDAAGICRPGGRVVLPATPPPDVNLPAWRESAARILAWSPDQLFLTHFGPQPSPRLHFQDFWSRMEAWSRRVQALLASPGSDDERAARFLDEVMDELTRTAGAAAARGYMSAGRFDFSYAGLARYWRKASDRGHDVTT
jgi:glyoxylase-like metal-dependent hydrolase (beta-lactamase superfamily II)